MKIIFYALILALPLHSMALLDSYIATKPNRPYMNFFLESYLKWFDQNYHYRPSLESIDGNKFLEIAIKELDHWRTKENKFLDQFLIGKGFDQKNQGYFNFRIYIHERLRNHPYLKKQSLSFTPWFISQEEGLTCFIGPIDVLDVPWKVVPRFERTLYLQHHCRFPGETLKLSYISMQTFHQESENKNPFRGQSESELRIFDQLGENKVLYFVKETHVALIPDKYFSFIFSQGQIANLSFDKYSIDRDGKMVIYYP